MVGVGQDWIGGVSPADHRLGPGLILHSQGNNLRIPVTEFLYICFQLNQLVPAGPSGLPPVKNKDDIAFVSIILQ